MLAGRIGDIAVDSYGAKARTFNISSQCWGNDLWMSSTGKTRNRRFGELIGESLSPQEAIKEMQKQNKTVESLQSLQSLQKYKEIIELPLIEAVYSYLILNESSLEDIKNVLLSDRAVA